MKHPFTNLAAVGFAALLVISCTSVSLAAAAGNSSKVSLAPAIKVLNRAIYVSDKGDDKNDGLSAGKALRSPQKAADMTAPGDVVYFSGEWEKKEGGAILTIKRSGAPGLPITYAPAPGAKALIRSSGAWDAIKVSGARHIVIQGFRVIGNAKNVTMEQALADANVLKPATSGNGIAVMDDTETKTPAAYITVRNCEVSDCSGGGIFANHADYLTFEDNVVYRCAFWSANGNSGLSVYQPTAIDDFTGYKIFICNNVCFENYQNIPFIHSSKDPAKRKVTDGNGIIIDDYLNTQYWGGGGGRPYPGRTLVANNVVFANGGSGIHSYKSCNVDIVFNYAADNNRHPDLKDGQIFGNSSKNMRILNNIMVAPEDKPVTSGYKAEGITKDYNLYATLDGGTPKFDGQKLNNLVAAPGLELIGWDSGKRIFKVTTNSPLRGAGIPLTNAPADYFGKARNADKPDIGPFVLGKN